MDEQALRTYLDGHLVGARTVTQLVDRRLEDGVGPEWMRSFRADLEEDRQIVEDIADRLDASGLVPSHLAASAAQAATRGALRVIEELEASLRDLLEFETMYLGVQGKAALWRTLQLWAGHPAIADVDLDRLEQRAADHAAKLEAFRIGAARGLDPEPSQAELEG